MRGHSLRRGLIGPAVTLSVALAGCTAGAGGPTAGWVEPGWMALVRQENERFQSGQIACYAEFGLTPVRAMGGSVGFVNLPEDAATQALLEEASAVCNERVPLPAHSVDKTLDDAAYGRMVELRECIVAHGFELPEPPSAATWKDSGLEYAWNPYQPLIDAGSSVISQKELFALDQACPQPGPNFYARAPTGD